MLTPRARVVTTYIRGARVLLRARTHSSALLCAHLLPLYSCVFVTRARFGERAMLLTGIHTHTDMAKFSAGANVVKFERAARELVTRCVHAT